MQLVIVESPTKAKTIGRFLKSGYNVISSYGHIRDLPKSKLGVDVEKNFEPHYIIPTKARKKVTALKKAAEKADRIILATDEDREGEAIAWHILQALGLQDNSRQPTADSRQKKTKKKSGVGSRESAVAIARIVFHEITEEAIKEALEHPRGIAMPLVDAQQARRILDRLVGYNLSPFLWKKVARGLSAGRVQSVAVRLVVEREREREAFKPQEYWTLEATLQGNAKDQSSLPTADPPKVENAKSFTAALVAKDKKKLDKFALPNKKAAQEVLDDLKDAAWNVQDVKEKDRKLNPLAPFRTSTLQQTASHRLRFSAKQTMRLAQQLYEGVPIDGKPTGLITYMRTDALTLSDNFLNATQAHLKKALGKDYAKGARRYTKKVKGAQEAHEAIRPTDVTLTPELLKGKLDSRQWKLYNLIWRRAVASQMPPAQLKNTTVNIDAKGAAHEWGFRATGSRMIFDGFTRVWKTSREDSFLPKLEKGQALNLEKLEPTQHFTEPPPRYSEATLIKTLEAYGIGRPSTYAPTLSTIQTRGYIERDDNRRLKPTDIGMLVNDLLVEHFKKIVDYAFTAKMEEDLDEIAQGEKQWQAVVGEFWEPFSEKVEEKMENVKRVTPKAEPTDETCEKCGKQMVKKFGRFGPFIACSGFPDCRNTKTAPEQRTGITCPKCEKGEVVPRRSKRGKKFYGCSEYPACDFVAWDEPVDKKCPECQSLLVKTKKGQVKCPSKTCDYTERTSESSEE